MIVLSHAELKGCVNKPGLAKNPDGVVEGWIVRPSLPGELSDINRNGFVDFEDLTILLANWNKPDATASQGNLVFPETSSVDFVDLTFLLADWTGPGPAGSPEAALGAEAVPEPSTMLLLAIATLGLSFYRRRRQRAF